MRTSFHHQPEAQLPKSPAIETPAGRLPHLSATSRHSKSDSRRTDPYSAGCAAPPRFVAPCSPDARAAKNVITAQASEQAARKYRPAWKLPVESLIQPTTKGPT